MVTSVKKWGNSLGIKLPKAITEEILVSEGSRLTIVVKNGKIELAKAENEIHLEDLLSGINKSNLHSEIDTEIQIGNEL